MPYVFISLAALLLLLVGTAAYTFLRIFYSARRPSTDEIPTPDGSIYDPYREQMRSWVRQLRAMEHLEAEVRTPDGLTLRGAFYRAILPRLSSADPDTRAIAADALRMGLAALAGKEV